MAELLLLITLTDWVICSETKRQPKKMRSQTREVFEEEKKKKKGFWCLQTAFEGQSSEWQNNGAAQSLVRSWLAAGAGAGNGAGVSGKANKQFARELDNCTGRQAGRQTDKQADKRIDCLSESKQRDRSFCLPTLFLVLWAAVTMKGRSTAV